MNRLRLGGILGVFVAWAAAGTVLWAEVRPWESPHQAAVTVMAGPPKPVGMVEVWLSCEVLDLARADLADLRVVDSFGTEVPFVHERTRRPPATVASVSATLLNRTFLPSKSSTVTADFGRKFLKDHVQVRTAGLNFRRAVLVESSDDGVSWQTARQGALLFRIGSPSRVEFEKDDVAIPDNNHRFLRITVQNSAEETGPVEILEVHAPAVADPQLKPPRLAPVEIRSSALSQNAKVKATVIELDLGFRNLPLDRIDLAFDDPNFFRRVRIEGRDEKTQVVHYRREDGAAADRTVDAPWQFIRSAVIFRYSAGSPPDACLSVPLDVSRRYLRLTIENEDNPPLAFKSATVTRFMEVVRFPYKPQESWKLYFGKADADTPGYDLAHFAGRLQSEGTVDATLRQVVANPLYSPAGKFLPWSERHPVILWLALIAAGAVLAILILRQARSLRSPKP
jgi:hypothetical protein